MTPIGLADDIRRFGTIYGQIVAAKPQAIKYTQTYATWQDLMTRGENLRQVVTTVQNMSPVVGQLETLISGVFGSLIPANILPSGINAVNLYSISGWESDANSFLTQLQQVKALENSGVSSTEISNTIQTTGLQNTLTQAGSSLLSGVSNIALIGGIIIAGYLYFMMEGRK